MNNPQKLYLVDTCALRSDKVRADIRAEVFSRNEETQMVLPKMVLKELHRQSASSDTRTRGEVEAALRFVAENAGRFIQMDVPAPAVLKADSDHIADDEMVRICTYEAMKGHEVVLYSQDYLLAYRAVHIQPDSSVTVRMNVQGRGLDYKREILPAVMQSLKDTVGHYGCVFLTSAAVEHKSFSLCFRELGFADMLKAAGKKLCLFDVSLHRLSPGAQQLVRKLQREQLLTIETRHVDIEDEFSLISTELNMTGGNPVLLLCASCEEARRYYGEAEGKDARDYSTTFKPHKTAFLTNGGKVIRYNDKLAPRAVVKRAAVALPAKTAVPAVSAAVPQAPYQKERLAAAVNKGDMPLVKEMLRNGGNACWAVAACLCREDNWKYLGELLDHVQTMHLLLKADWFVEIVSHMQKVWRHVTTQSYEYFKRFIPKVIEVCRYSESLGGCQEELKHLNRWYQACSDAAVKQLLQQMMMAVR